MRAAPVGRQITSKDRPISQQKLVAKLRRDPCRDPCRAMTAGLSRAGAGRGCPGDEQGQGPGDFRSSRCCHAAWDPCRDSCRKQPKSPHTKGRSVSTSAVTDSAVFASRPSALRQAAASGLAGDPRRPRRSAPGQLQRPRVARSRHDHREFDRRGRGERHRQLHAGRVRARAGLPRGDAISSASSPTTDGSQRRPPRCQRANAAGGAPAVSGLLPSMRSRPNRHRGGVGT